MADPYGAAAAVRDVFPSARLELRGYQQDAISRAREAFKAGARAVLLVAPTGAGKTIVGAEVARLAAERGSPVVWVAHRSELLRQAAGKLRALGLTAAVVAPGEPEDASAQVQVCSVQTLRARGLAPPAGMLIVDECVTGDTVVGGRPARLVQVGDLVESWDGLSVRRRRVTHRFENHATTLRTIHAGGRALCVTDSHPVWVIGKGWSDAKEVVPGDLLHVWSRDESDLWAGKKDLLCGVPSPEPSANHGLHKQEVRIGADAPEESDALRGVSRAHASNPVGDGAPSERAGRERMRHAPSAEIAAGGPRAPVGAGVRGAHRSGIGTTQRGQGGCGTPGAQSSDRGGRVLSHGSQGTGRRSAEVGVPGVARVDRVEVHEPGDDGSFGGRAPDGRVYNFEVEGEHNFFANGILTHNCHHYAADDWSQLLGAYSCPRVGLTATPVRSDGRGLRDAFDRLVEVTTIRDLTADGHLVPCRVVAPDRDLGTGARARSVLDAYRSHCAGRKTVVFVDTVARAHEDAAELQAAGVAAAVIHGGLSAQARAAALEAHAQGAVLLNVYVLTEGWDSPETSAAILARGCGSVGTYLQIVGRILRPAPGKTDAVLVDLRGQAFHEHGAPDEPRRWHLAHGIGKGAETDKYCQVCGALLDGYPCTCCGYEPEDYVPPPVRVTGDELAERYAAKRAESSDKRAETLAKWIAASRDAGHKPGAPLGKFKAVYGHWPPTHLQQEARRLAKSIRTHRCGRCRTPVPLPYGVESFRSDWRCVKCR